MPRCASTIPTSACAFRTPTRLPPRDEGRGWGYEVDQLEEWWEAGRKKIMRYRLGRGAISDRIARALEPAKAQGHFTALPFGSDFTEEEQRLLPALGWLREASGVL